MSTVRLTKWGNSIGVRIPANIIKEAHLKKDEELQIMVNEEGGLTLIPHKNEQADWTDQFNAIADAKMDEPLLDVANTFDDDQWTW